MKKSAISEGGKPSSHVEYNASGTIIQFPSRNPCPDGEVGILIEESLLMVSQPYLRNQFSPFRRPSKGHPLNSSPTSYRPNTCLSETSSPSKPGPKFKTCPG